MNIETSGIYFRNNEATTRYIFNEGGTRSTKTYSLNQVAYTKAAQSETPIIFSIVSETMPHLRKGAMRDFFSFLKNNNLYSEKYHNKSENIYEVNKSIIEFFSVDSPGKVHGPERDYLFANELQYIDYDTFFHLAQRTRKQIYADWNPVTEFWIYPEFVENPQYKDDITLIHSTLLDNPFISEEIKKDILLRAERDPNYRRVYLEGKIGHLEGIIFTNWAYGDFDTSLPFGYGLDFGFYPDPDAMIKVAIDKKRKIIYVSECFYQTNQLVENLKANVARFARPSDLIVADSASPRMIAELKGNAGTKHRFNVRPVIKTAGSVNEGLRILQDYQIVVDKESVNMVKEFRNYIWSDKKAGIPIDAYNHLIDPLRYYALTQLSSSSGYQKWSA
jgi:phage terminase large subunit